jgi:hypothetical protein
MEFDELHLVLAKARGILTEFFGNLPTEIVATDFDLLDFTSCARSKMKQGLIIAGKVLIGCAHVISFEMMQ